LTVVIARMCAQGALAVMIGGQYGSLHYSINPPRDDDGSGTRRIEPHVRRCARDSQYDAITPWAPHDRSHSMGVDKQRTDRPRHAAAGALCARGGEIRDEQLTQNAGSRISVDSTHIGKALTSNNWVI
jgi:hypothetical protein